MTYPGIALAAMIILPGLASLGLIHTLYWLKNLRSTKKNLDAKQYSAFKIYPEEGLADQGLLWLSILAPAAYFFTFGTVAWSEHIVQINAEGFESFIKISTLPIGLLSLAVPLSLLVMRVHSTKQTATQIKITKHKNNLDTYYAHRKAMFDYFSIIDDIEYEGKITGSFHLHPRLHLKFFKNTPPDQGIPAVDTVKIEEMLALLQHARVAIFHVMSHSTNDSDRITHYLNACTSTYKLANLLSLEPIYKTLHDKSFEVTILENNKVPDSHPIRRLYTLGKTQEETIGAFRYSRSYARLICEFCGYTTESFSQEDYADVDKGNNYTSAKYYQIINAIPRIGPSGLRTIEKTENLDI